MYEERRKRWFAAARSGKYKQAKDVLKQEDGCCCILGIACEVYQEEVGDLKVEVPGTGDVVYDGHAHCLPVKVQRYFNIADLGYFVSPVLALRDGQELEIHCATNANYFFPLDKAVDILEQAEFQPCPL